MKNRPDLTLADKLYMKHIPNDLTNKTIINVGAGECRMDYHLNQMGYKVYSTDYDDRSNNNNSGYHPIFLKKIPEIDDGINYYNNCDLFDLNSFPIDKADLVICSQMLEHQPNYKQGVMNLLELANEFVIITIPHERSFLMPGPPPIGHCNFWSKTQSNIFTDIKEFINICSPYKVTFSMGITKIKDYHNPNYPRNFVVCIDKRTTEQSDGSIYDYTQEQLNWK